MDAYEAILSRRMVSEVLPEPPTKQEIEALLDAAVRAPNHHLTQPWRFIVLKGSALDDLGEAMAQRLVEMDPATEGLADKIALEKSRPHRAPVIIVIVYTPSSHPKAIEVEDRYAIGAAAENLLLAAHAKGLGGYWRTGPAAEFAGVKRHLGLGEAEEIAGFIYVGYPDPDGPATMSKRDPSAERTIWKGWD